MRATTSTDPPAANGTTIVIGRDGLKIADIKSKSNSQQVVFPRKVAMFLLRKLSELSYPEIGKLFNDKHHSTVMYAVKDIEERRAKDTDLDRVLAGLEQQFG